MPSICLACALCLFSLFIAAPVWAQDEPDKVPPMSDEIKASILENLRKDYPDLELNWEDLNWNEEKRSVTIRRRTRRYPLYTLNGSMKEITVDISRKGFNTFKSEIKKLIAQNEFPPLQIVNLGLHIAELNKSPAKPLFKELIEFIGSQECTLPEPEKKQWTVSFEHALRRAVGHDPTLYGKTLDGKDFDWESLRGKYVMIQFTATWCGPCRRMIPGMLEAYKKYHDKGLEIVSVYIWQDEPDAITVVKDHVDKEKLPWIILSEDMSKQSGMPEYKDFYVLHGIPELVLVDKEGKVIATDLAQELQTALAEIFE